MVGVAGLSIASAAYLDLTAADEVAIGNVTFEALASGAHVSYRYDDNYVLSELKVSDIDKSEKSREIEVILKDVEDNVLFSGTADIHSDEVTFDVKGEDGEKFAPIPLDTDLGDVIVIIGPPGL